MSISKRLRFEILRRDNHTCQYCGDKAPDVTLHVDHVIPVSLGGGDQPSNLLAACKDCNLGKTSVPAGAPLVAAVGEMSATYALNMTHRMTLIRASLEMEEEYLDDFEAAWRGWKVSSTDQPVALPVDYRSSIYRWAKMGVPMSLVERAIRIAMTKTGLHGTDCPEFQYMAGVVWRTLEETDVPLGLTEATVAVATAFELEEQVTEARIEGYEYALTGVQANGS
jgi:hypothetical protein